MNNKGFTLIELLAIIVILAIIAVITIPIVANIRRQAHEASMVDSAYGYVDAVNKLYFSNSLNSSNSEIDDGTYTVAQLKTMGITVNGREPSEGCVVLEDGNVSNYSLKFGDYAVNYNSTNKTAIAEKNGELNGCASTIQYGYKSYGDSEITISTSNPTGKNAYLRYALTNGVVVSGTVPEACVYNANFDGELCLKNNEFETSVQKIKDYFGYDASTWTNTSGGTWVNPDQSASCHFYASQVFCSDDSDEPFIFVYTWDVGIVRTYGHGFDCNVSSENVAECR